jgi:hypothetical protein
MPIILPHDLTSAEIRVLQEFRRLNVDTLSIDTIKALKHPAGGGETPATGLVAKGFLETGGTAESFSLTQKAKELLAIDARPMFEEAPAAAASTDEIAAADGA